LQSHIFPEILTGDVTVVEPDQWPFTVAAIGRIWMAGLRMRAILRGMYSVMIM